MAARGAGLRSRRWFARTDELGMLHRAALRAIGITIDADDPRPVIGLAQSSGDVNPCNSVLVPLVDDVRAGIVEAGGIPIDFPTITLGEDLMKPSAMLYRNLMAIDVEESIRAYPIDGVVLLANCDKTVPAQLMAAASADLPAIQLTGGARISGSHGGERLRAGTDLWHYADARRAGQVDDPNWASLEAAFGCSAGACDAMGTAVTMAAMSEALGFMLPGVAGASAGDPGLRELARETGRRAVALVRDDLRPSDLITASSLRNAIVVLAALGGSTNAVIHLAAIAGRRRIPLPLRLFDEVSRGVPVLADVAPIGTHSIDAFAVAGGVPAVERQVVDMLSLDAMTVTGEPLGALLDLFGEPRGPAVRHRRDPVHAEGGIAVLTGNLAPDGAVLKVAAATPGLLRHTGPAVVFRGYSDMLDRIDDPSLEVSPDSVLVLAGGGPVGGPGMPEWGMLPIPRRLGERGVTDIVRVSDARMSGTGYGTVVLHVAPEAAVGGPLGRVRDGDLISLDVQARRLDVLVPADELAARPSVVEPPPLPGRGWIHLYSRHVTQAPQGCDLDFLVPTSDADLEEQEPVVGRS